MDNLDVAVQRSQAALDLMSADDPGRASQLHNLGYLHHERYNNYSTPTKLEDLDTAIRNYHASIDLTPDAYPLRAARLHDLGTGYNDKYHRIKVLRFLDDAILQFQLALKLTPYNDPDRGTRIQSLASSYDDKYERTKALEDLECAILHFEEPLDVTADDHPLRVALIEDLAPAYHAKYSRTGDIEDLSKTIRYLKEAIDLSPDEMFRSDMHMNLGKRYYDRYLKTKSAQDLEMMIHQCQDALDWMPEGVTSRQPYYFLGAGYYHKYQKTKDMNDLQLSTEYCEKAFDSPVAHSPYYWIRSGNLLVSILAETKQWSSASRVASATISQIHQLAPRASSIPDKQLVLGEVSQLASDAAALTLIAGDEPLKALQTLELGQNVITNSLSDMRTDISNLLQEHRELGEEYIRLRDELNTLRLNDESYNPEIAIRKQDWQLKIRGPGNMERLIQKIQAMPGFERFLVGPTEAELKSAAELGPVVIINVSDYRCDAVIITKDQIRSLSLPELCVDDIRFRAETYMTKPDSFLLEWLWDTIAKPVLDSLGFVQIPQDRWPHVWWISTGLLAKFPIHAAGYHDSSDTVLDRVISSYSSSVRTILKSRKKDSSEETEWEPNKIVAVGLTKTRGQKDLPFVQEEITDLKRIWGQISTPDPRREDILAALKDCKVFHFAGHALADRLDPLQSSLILGTEHLSVASVFEVNLQSNAPFLAYLSACGTGQVKQNELINERLHLIAAYQLAGFRHVIGTLWEVNDESCVGIATETYEWIKARKMTDESVSEGLHHASRKFRMEWVLENAAKTARKSETNRLQRSSPQSDLLQNIARDMRDVELCEDSPATWIPYVHFGS